MSLARHGEAWHGWARCDLVRRGMDWQGQAGLVLVRLGKLRQGETPLRGSLPVIPVLKSLLVRSGWVRSGVVRWAKARLGEAG